MIHTRQIFLAIFSLLVFISFGFSQNGIVVNYYNISKQLTFGKIEYSLSWSTHPQEAYYKQEYVPKGDNVEHFNDMLLIDFLITDLPVKDAVQNQMSTLLARKKTDPVCNYQIQKNAQTGDYVLDFIIGDSSENNTVEWNAYHYKSYTDKAGHKGVLLFGISHRAYGNETVSFLKSLKNSRQSVLRSLITYPVPEIQVK